MNTIYILKVIGVSIAVIVILFLLSLFSLWTELARYQHYWTRQNNEPTKSNQIQYVALGDSIAQGIGASHPSKGYVGIISKELAQKYNKPVQTVNLSKSGAKVSDVLSTQLPELERQGITDKTIITLDIGGNDMINFDAEQFEREMDELMGKLPTQTVMSDLPYFGDSRYKSKESNVEAANAIMYKLAAKHGLRLVPLHEKMKQNGGLKTLAPDFFHPSNTAYKENWAPVFMERL